MQYTRLCVHFTHSYMYVTDNLCDIKEEKMYMLPNSVFNSWASCSCSSLRLTFREAKLLITGLGKTQRNLDAVNN